MVLIRTCLAFVGVSHSYPRLKTFSHVAAVRPKSWFHGHKVPNLQARLRQRVCNFRSTPRMLVDPWSVSPAALDVLSGQFFAISLIPYLAFLYYLNRPSVKCPPLANFGFRFLLVFVFATIPAGIYAKVHYHDILANVDILHGAAESLLTVTNLLIVLGFRGALQPTKREDSTASRTEGGKKAKLSVEMIPLGIMALAGAGLTIHAEPANALSFPTWIIHVSSLIEWLVAMGLVWRYAETTNKSEWKGLTWGMLPLHTSGICACTYHLFYNAASLNFLVTVQAMLTCIGNGTMAFATYRLGRGNEKKDSVTTSSQDGVKSLVGFEDLAEVGDSDGIFVGKVFLISALGSAAVKWGELLFNQPFESDGGLAMLIIGVPTAMNMLKWAVRSQGNEKFGGMF